MRPAAVILLIVGVLVLLAGVTFTLQGMGMVGPQGSVMYNSSTWVYQGAATAVVGLVILAGGVVLGRRSPSVSAG